MSLERSTNRYPADAAKESESFERCSKSEVRTRFKDFGGKNSTFDVYLTWRDVERAINEFCTQGAPEAVRIQKALRLAEAINEISN